ncbi:type VI secretion system contractile sheath large subunit [Acetobacter sp. TBRC 12305]|uniref:Type VI secretion system contractile sheath large subunit n=1 Tax=Acetobacter garciniae TaxID=2817435 RepID=A0A939HQG3_9PROT|nr:type VI secretion system contractile sheath large subunit [Acetobacter garciniae]MBO1326519.1 type VI secretion system contractile sheath large subunit [Acetobacter garciniae]MBX0346165.1 type VI secretion system contractile sheath large subunit [Acetobacter garciniae]
MTNTDDNSDATVIRRPAAPAAGDKARQDSSHQPPLRDAVLSGAFFGTGQEDNARRVAVMLTRTECILDTWFGDRAPVLRADTTALAARIERDIVTLDRMIARQLDAIVHHARMRRLEGSWRALDWLAVSLPLSGRIKLRFLDLTWQEVCRDLERATAFDQSHLFRQIYEQEFGIAGGEPFGLLVADYEIRHRPGPGAPTDDISALMALSQVAAAAFAPLVVGASPALFGVDDFGALSGVPDPVAVMAAVDYQRWKKLRAQSDTRFLSVTLPRVTMRRPWNETLHQARGFRYREGSGAADTRVWSTAGYLVAACAIRAFEAYSWPADMRGYDMDREGGGVIDTLAQPLASIDPPEGNGRPALDLILTDRQERALVAAGFMPVSAIPFGGELLIGTARSLQQPDTGYSGPNKGEAIANSRLSAQFNSILCVSRFSHYLKVMGRDMTGAFMTATEIQDRLRRWLARYTTANPGSMETLALYPLRQAEVSVADDLARPGVFSCVIHLEPHFQLDDVAVTFRLVTELSAPGRG